jgi:hypothetical protein
MMATLIIANIVSTMAGMSLSLVWAVSILLMVAPEVVAQPPKPAGNFLQQAFGVQPLTRNPLLSPEFPWVSARFADSP